MRFLGTLLGILWPTLLPVCNLPIDFLRFMLACGK